ncbi:MAG: serpin family protein [Planctomycetes bacterium]|nr:serpin family protein [Planctomycetota bacterium]
MKVFLSISVFVLGFCFLGDKEISKTDQKVLTGKNTKFAFNLFSKLFKEEAGKNLFISPLSISIALQLAYNGSDSTTKKEMAKVLNVDDLDVNELNELNKSMLETLNSHKHVKLSIANSVWLNTNGPIKDLKIRSEFYDIAAKYYSAEAKAINFQSKDAAKTINGWIEEKTNKKIKDVINDPIDPSVVAYLINAIYFKGTWATTFDKELTAEKDFFIAQDKKVNHPFMYQKGTYKYLENNEFQAVSIPYGRDKSASMYIFLPNEKDGLKKFSEQLTTENWNGFIASFKNMDGSIRIPVFRLEYKKLLNDTLEALGMKSAFRDSQADFSRLFDPSAGIYISRVIHQSFVDVNEEGTEAAAATVVEFAAKGISREFDFTADHPFFYAIVDNKTGAILFMGTLVEPPQKS